MALYKFYLYFICILSVFVFVLVFLEDQKCSGWSTLKLWHKHLVTETRTQANFTVERQQQMNSMHHIHQPQDAHTPDVTWSTFAFPSCFSSRALRRRWVCRSDVVSATLNIPSWTLHEISHNVHWKYNFLQLSLTVQTEHMLRQTSKAIFPNSGKISLFIFGGMGNIIITKFIDNIVTGFTAISMSASMLIVTASQLNCSWKCPQAYVPNHLWPTTLLRPYW